MVDVVEHDIDVGAAVLRRPQFIEHGGPLELVERALEAESRALCALNKGDDPLDQAARQPVIGGLANLAGASVLKAAGVFLGGRRAAVEMDGVRRAFDWLGGDRDING